MYKEYDEANLAIQAVVTSLRRERSVDDVTQML